MIPDLLTSSLVQYYGTDWAAMVFMFLSLYELSNKKQIGFAYGVIACFFWFVFGILAGSIASPIANVIFMGLNMRGYLKWTSHPKPL